LDSDEEVASDRSSSADSIPSRQQSQNETQIKKVLDSRPSFHSQISQHFQKIANQTQDFSGFLLKQGTDNTVWERRWFVLGKEHLFLYHHFKDANILGKLPLRNCLVKDVSKEELKVSHPFAFEVHAPDASEVWTLETASQSEKEIWKYALQLLSTSLEEAQSNDVFDDSRLPITNGSPCEVS